MISRFQIAYKNLLRKKSRTLLTFVGIMLSSWVCSASTAAMNLP